MTTQPTPDRYDVADYTSKTDPRRMATIRDVVTANILTVTTEDEARNLIAKLTAWLDAPRLAARATPEVVAQIDEYALIRTSAGEWGTRTDGGVEWSANEADARAEFRDLTGAERCESCGEYRDREDVAATEDGVHVCIDDTACNAAIAAKEPK